MYNLKKVSQENALKQGKIFFLVWIDYHKRRLEKIIEKKEIRPILKIAKEILNMSPIIIYTLPSQRIISLKE